MIFPVDLTDNYVPALTHEHEYLYAQLQSVISSSSCPADILYHMIFHRVGMEKKLHLTESICSWFSPSLLANLISPSFNNIGNTHKPLSQLRVTTPWHILLLLCSLTQRSSSMFTWAWCQDSGVLKFHSVSWYPLKVM